MKINGQECDFVGKTITEYLETTNYSINRIAIECNGKIVPKNYYCETILKEGDTLEVVSFVGGG